MNVYLVWTKAHVGTEGNEKADQMAKAGALLPDIEDVGKPQSRVKSEIEDKIRERWDLEWERYPHARQTKFFYPQQNKNAGKIVMQMNRMELGRYLRVITGHNNLFYHRSNIDPINNNSICRFCLEEDETFIHFATNCPALWRERRDHLLVYEGDGNNTWTPNQLLDFSFSRRITEALEMDHREDGNQGALDADNPEAMSDGRSSDTEDTSE